MLQPLNHGKSQMDFDRRTGEPPQIVLGSRQPDSLSRSHLAPSHHVRGCDEADSGPKGLAAKGLSEQRDIWRIHGRARKRIAKSPTPWAVSGRTSADAARFTGVTRTFQRGALEVKNWLSDRRNPQSSEAHRP